MIKKLFVILFIALMLLSLGACKDDTGVKDNSEDSSFASASDNATTKDSIEESDAATTTSDTVEENDTIGNFSGESLTNIGDETNDPSKQSGFNNNGSLSSDTNSTVNKLTEPLENDIAPINSGDGVDLPFHQW